MSNAAATQPSAGAAMAGAGGVQGGAGASGVLTPAQARAYMGRSDPLFFRIHDFHSRPAEYADPSQLASLLPVPSAALEAILATGRGREALSAWILRKLNLTSAPWASFEIPTSRLALLPGPLLRRASVLAGASICAQQIARIISRDELADLKAKIGDDVRTFALKTAPILLGAPPAVGPVQPPESGIAAMVLASGRRVLETALSGESPHLLKRLRLKFNISQLPDFAPVPLAEKAKAGAYLTRIVTRELAPDWAPCFV